MSSVFQRTSTYAGLSSASILANGQQLSLCASEGSDVQAKLTLTDSKMVVGLRDAFISVLYHLRKGFSYKPSEIIASSPELQASFDALGQNYDQNNAIRDHQQLINFISEHDPSAFLQPDAQITVTEEGLLWEIFSKKSTMSASIFINKDVGETSDWKNGSTTVDTSLALLNSLENLNGSTLSIEVSTNPLLTSGYKATSTYSKTESIPLYWPRTWLQLQADVANPTATLELNKMEAYNFIRYLRLNKKAAKRRSLTLQFESGSHPAIIVQPFQKRFVASSQIYDGSSFQAESWETDLLWIFEPLLPIINKLCVRNQGTALPVIWEADCGGFTLSISELGYSPANWSKGIQMDVKTPRTELSAKEDRISSIQKGEMYFNPFAQREFARLLFPSLDISQIVYRDQSEEKAHGLVFQPTAAQEHLYSKVNSALMKVQTYLPNAKDLETLTVQNQSIEKAITLLQTKVSGIQLSQIKHALHMFTDVAVIASEILRMDPSKTDTIVQYKTREAFNKAIRDTEIATELWEYLRGKPAKRLSTEKKGMFAKIAEAISSPSSIVDKTTIEELWCTSYSVDFDGRSQYDIMNIRSALKELLDICASSAEAEQFIGNRAVVINTKVNLDESVDFLNCSVTDSDGRFSPQFTYSTVVGLQRPSCTCTREREEICSHMKTLWLQYCINEKALAVAQKEDVSLITNQSAIYIELTGTSEIAHKVEQKHRVLVITNGMRKTKRIFTDVTDAHFAFTHQVDIFENKGFLRAGE